jgi:hypothetical protein
MDTQTATTWQTIIQAAGLFGLAWYCWETRQIRRATVKQSDAAQKQLTALEQSLREEQHRRNQIGNPAFLVKSSNYLTTYERQSFVLQNVGRTITYVQLIPGKDSGILEQWQDVLEKGDTIPIEVNGEYNEIRSRKFGFELTYNDEYGFAKRRQYVLEFDGKHWTISMLVFSRIELEKVTRRYP